MSRSKKSLSTLLVGALLIGLCSNYQYGAQASSPVKLLDADHKHLSLDSLAEAVCHATDSRAGQLSRFSSIQRLVSYFESEVSEGHKLHECKKQHAEALHSLSDVLSASLENVCSADKLALIEDYHDRFVSTQVEHVKQRHEQNREVAPHLLNLLFMHYAMDVDALCKRTLINNLEWDLKEKFGDDINDRLFLIDDHLSDDERRSFSNIFNGVMNKFTDLYSVEKYDDVIMIWDLLKGSVLSQQHDKEIMDEFDPATGEPIRLMVKVKSAKYLNRIKRHCYYKLKPIYSKLITPIIRLSDLGYSNTGEQFKVELDELKSNDNVKRWYSTTQLCEALLPVKFFEDPNLTSEDVVVIEKEESAELLALSKESAVPQDEEEALVYEPETNSMLGRDMLESVETKETQEMVKNIKSNVSKRDRSMTRAIVRLLKNLKNQLKNSRIGRIFFSKKSSKLANPKSNEKEQHFVKEEIGTKFAQSLDQMSEKDLLKVDGASGRLMKASDSGSGIGKRVRHHRKGDQDMLMEMRAEAISHKRTLSWGEIFSGWGKWLEAISPSRTQMIIFGGVIIGLFVIILLVAIYTVTLG